MNYTRIKSAAADKYYYTPSAAICQASGADFLQIFFDSPVIPPPPEILPPAPPALRRLY